MNVVYNYLIRPLAGPGNLVRQIFELGGEPQATLAVTAFFIMGLAFSIPILYLYVYLFGRVEPMLPHALYVKLLVIFVLLQGPLSAVI